MDSRAACVAERWCERRVAALVSCSARWLLWWRHEVRVLWEERVDSWAEEGAWARAWRRVGEERRAARSWVLWEKGSC